MLDTNVVVSALLWDGTPKRLLNLARSKDIFFITSAPLLAELADILLRPKFEHRIAASLLSIDDLLTLYAELAAVVRPAKVPRLAPDPDDDVVVGTALAAKADFIVTGDRTLLLVAQYQRIRIISVRDALNLVMPS